MASDHSLNVHEISTKVVQRRHLRVSSNFRSILRGLHCDRLMLKLDDTVPYSSSMQRTLAMVISQGIGAPVNQIDVRRISKMRRLHSSSRCYVQQSEGVEVVSRSFLPGQNRPISAMGASHLIQYLEPAISGGLASQRISL